MDLNKLAAIVTIVGFPIAILGIFIGIYQIHQAVQTTRSQNNISLGGEFFNSTNTGIIAAIEYGKPILKPKGKFSLNELDNYLGEFEIINSTLKSGFLNVDDFCINFSYYIASTSENHEVEAYLDKNPDYFGSLNELATFVKTTKNPLCH